jgi:hypothetical protein
MLVLDESHRTLPIRTDCRQQRAAIAVSSCARVRVFGALLVRLVTAARELVLP